MTEDTVIIDLKRVRFSSDDAALLKSLKDSDTSEHQTYASLVRLFVRMGLTLHRNGIHTVGQLETLLKRVSEPELRTLEDRITERVIAALQKQPSVPPRKK